MREQSKITRHTILSGAIVALAFAIVGTVLLFSSHAATPTAVEPENGTLTTATSVTDSTASGGKAVKFGSGTAVDDTNKKCSQITGLKFCDDFDTSAGTYPDSTKWNVFASGSSWGSQCWQKNPNNISTDGQGNLKLTVIDTGTTLCTNSYGVASTYSSGGMDTSGKFTTKFGRIEFRAKLSCADSIWGSFWLSTGTGPGWPGSGEIDVYELGYLKFYRLQQTFNVPTTSGTNPWVDPTYVDLPTTQRWCDAYHIYGVDWRQDSIQFMVDRQPTAKLTPATIPSNATWPFNTYDLRILIDQQYGMSGKWTGAPNPAQLPTSTLVDWVRVYN